jgi:hypothetical protein
MKTTSAYYSGGVFSSRVLRTDALRSARFSLILANAVFFEGGSPAEERLGKI